MSETELLIKARAGEQGALRKLFSDNVDNLYRFLIQFSRNSDQVEDWVQSAFIKAFKNLDSFEGLSKFSTWLFKIGINEMRGDLKKESRKRTVPLNERINEIPEESNDDFEWHSEMKWILNGLDDEKKTVFILYEVENYSHAEISDMLNISEVASRTILHRTKKVLQEKWLTERSA